MAQQSSTTAPVLRERGVYAATVNGTEHYVVACSSDTGYVLYTPDEWLGDATADWEIDDRGLLVFQGDAMRGGGLTADDLTDTGFDATEAELRGQVGAESSMGTDWPIVAVLLRADDGVWWLDQIVNGGRVQCGEGGTFAEALAWARSSDPDQEAYA